MASQLDARPAKPEATIWDSVSTFASTKPLDIFNKTMGHFQPCMHFKPKYDPFLWGFFSSKPKRTISSCLSLTLSWSVRGLFTWCDRNVNLKKSVWSGCGGVKCIYDCNHDDQDMLTSLTCLHQPKPWWFPKANQVILMLNTNRTLTIMLSRHENVFIYFSSLIFNTALEGKD